MAEIASLGVPVISDEVYHGLVYEDTEHSILEFTDNAFVLNGFSKAYAMTGWRLGYLIAPQPFIRPMQKIQQNLFISPNAFVQWAGVAALREAGPDVLRMRSIYNERRIYIIRRLREMGLGICVEPTGAFYVLANISAFSRDSYQTAFDILRRRMSVLPRASILERTARATCAFLRQFARKYRGRDEPDCPLSRRAEGF